jgi:hypothetical protein
LLHAGTPQVIHQHTNLNTHTLQELLTCLGPLPPSSQVVHLLRDSLLAMGSAQPKLAKLQLDMLLRLLAMGQVEPVMAAMEVWSKEHDASLTRHMVACVLDMVAPPYSQQFADSMLRVMQRCMVKKLKEVPQGQRMMQLLHEFAVACSGVKFQPALGPKEAALLQELLSRL